MAGSTNKGGYGIYHGGFAWAPDPGEGALTFDSQHIELTHRTKLVVKVGVPVIESIEITSEQVAKTRIGAVLLFGVLGGLGARGAADRGTLLVHLKDGQTGYFTIGPEWSQSQLLGILAPWYNSLGIPLRRTGQPAPTTQPALSPISVADELTKLAGLRDSGILTSEEFETEKARLLGR